MTDTRDPSARPGLSCRILNQIIEENPECIVVTDPAGAIVHVNRRFEEVTGYTAAEAIGLNPRVLKSGQTPPETYEELWRTITAGRPWRGRFVNRKKNGELYIEDAQITPVLDDAGTLTHLVAVKKDITERVRLADAVRLLNEELFSILNTIPAWIFYKDRENRFIRVNQAFARDLRRSVGELEGTSCFDLFPKEQAEEFWKDDLQVIASGVPKERIVEPVTLADGIRWVQTEKMPLRDAAGGIIGVIGFANDITERKLMEDEIRRLTVLDDLTGLHNRRGFFVSAENALRIARRTQSTCLVILADMDGLKIINDTLGHETGDRALRELAEALHGVFRESDVVARLGGDEFAILAFNAPEAHAQTITARIDEAIRRRNDRPGRDYSLSLSLGISVSSGDHPVPLHALLDLADQRMYENKRRKKGH
ncbi:diguanylate cyclase [Myxococcota bacterium]|nr:diguanylate cyclase [Myxococcota bacterium]MBU1512199.1 diguanylate cyclase [Myxococcota bacterium]